MKDVSSEAFIIFSGYNPRGILSFIRVLKQLDIPFYVIAADEDDFIFSTAYSSNVLFVRNDKHLDLRIYKQIYEKLVLSLNYTRILLCPSSEYLNQHYLFNREVIEEQYKIFSKLPAKEIYDVITNKYSFCKYCSENSLDIPETYDSGVIGTTNFPFVAKPIENVMDGKTLYPYLITDTNSLDTFLENENTEHFYFQEFISGESYYFFYSFTEKYGIVSSSQQNIAQQPDGKSIVLAKSSTIHQHPISQKFIAALKKLSFSGILMIEVKKMGDKWYVIEANPRIWGPIQLCVDLNNNILDSYILDAVTLKTEPEKTKPLSTDVIYLWLGGILQTRRRGEKIVWHINSPIKLVKIIIKYLFNDVYFRKDSFKNFFREIIK